jgi:4-amino-4-deoxy-L-arabinose transferase-like glycosyltransferase
MLKNQIKWLKNPIFILSLVLFVFLLKGIFLALIFPIFQGPDEMTHYFRVQYLSSAELNKPVITENANDLNKSEELIETESIVQSQLVAGHGNNVQSFTGEYSGKNEEEITKNQWKHYTDIQPRKTPDFPVLYYKSASFIEDIFSSQDILTRFFLARIFSVFIGMAIIFLSYIISLKIGFSRKNSLLISAIISFQPIFSQTASIINCDILLFFAFTLFIFGACSLLKDQLNIKNFSILLVASVIGILTKGPGIVLFVVLFFLLAYGLKQKSGIPFKKFVIYFLLFSVLASALCFAIIPKNYLLSITQFNRPSSFSSFFHSLSDYYSSSKDFIFTNLSYWGNFGSLDSSISKNILQLIWLFEIPSFLGIFLIFINKESYHFLPQKKYLLFLIFIIFALQLAIRFFDWRIFDITGKIGIGTPGRYFMPNISAHFILILAGWGALLKSNDRFEIFLKTVFIFMTILNFYSIFNIIIPRYYL